MWYCLAVTLLLSAAAAEQVPQGRNTTTDVVEQHSDRLTAVAAAFNADNSSVFQVYSSSTGENRKSHKMLASQDRSDRKQKEEIIWEDNLPQEVKTEEKLETREVGSDGPTLTPKVGAENKLTTQEVLSKESAAEEEPVAEDEVGAENKPTTLKVLSKESASEEEPVVEDEVGAENKPTTQEVLSKESAAEEEKPVVEDEPHADLRAGRVLAQYRSQTMWLFATTTTNLLSTCYSAPATPSCTGRRRRRHVPAASPLLVDGDVPSLSSSASDHWEAEPFLRSTDEGSRHRRVFTVWSTLFTTYTLTSSSFFAGTTISITGLCSLSGLGSSCFG